MSTEAYKTMIRRVPEELFNRWNLDVADEVFAPDYIEHTPLPPGFPTGLPGIKTWVTLLRAAFPDFRYTVEDSIAEDDKVVLRLTAQGTQKGEFLGMPATGMGATWTETHVCRIAKGKLAEHWVNADQLGMMQQLGVIAGAAPVIG
ncbi:MAG TPA: ester cyclase [Roseiflexaceae bacterium]|jgi:predicted ester cyclase